MKKTLLLLVFLTLLLCVVLASCGDSATSSTPSSSQNTPDDTPITAEEVRILGINGPTGMGLANVIYTAQNAESSRYKCRILPGPEDAKLEILLGDYDIAALPTNVAAALYNAKKADFQIAAVNTLGVLYVIENGQTVTDIASLKGKTIHMFGQGSNPEYIVRHILKQNGLDPDTDVTFDFAHADHAAVASHVIATPGAIAILPEPQATRAVSGNSTAKVALDITAEWRKVSDSDVMMGCIVVRREFAEKYPEQLQQFLDDYRASIEFVNQNPDTASEIISNLGIIPKAALAKAAIPRCNIVFIDGEQMKNSLTGYFTALFNEEKTSIGGKVPDDGIYYQK